MRRIAILLLGLLTGACSIFDEAHYEIGPQPDLAELQRGIATAPPARFANPIEVTDIVRAPSNLIEPWMVCVRSGASNEARTLTYSVFFGRNYTTGKDGQFMRSQYSTLNDNCNAQTYHLYEPVVLPSPAASPESQANVEPAEKRRHRQ